EGYIKYQLHWQEKNAFPESCWQELSHYRQLFYQENFIGWDNELEVGFGNLSLKAQQTDVGFYISGTQTGGLPKLDQRHFCRVDRYDIDANQLWCSGPIKASSESLTHAAVYEANPHYQAVVHIHHRGMWEYFFDHLPTTSLQAAYGTPEMARAIQAYISESSNPPSQLVIMGGHQDGILAFGMNMECCKMILWEQYLHWKRVRGQM
ncbi:MAG: class II aldolase/adducin family protein, partial [Bacteroidota bacterium]